MFSSGAFSQSPFSAQAQYIYETEALSVVGTSSKFNPSALIQAQRDYFGAHQVQFKNSDEFIHLEWD